MAKLNGLGFYAVQSSTSLDHKYSHGNKDTKGMCMGLVGKNSNGY